MERVDWTGVTRTAPPQTWCALPLLPLPPTLPASSHMRSSALTAGSRGVGKACMPWSKAYGVLGGRGVLVVARPPARVCGVGVGWGA